MRRLVWLLVLLPALWSGWWLFASHNLHRGLERWFAERRSEGWQAEVSEIRTAGFPLALDKTLENPILADPQTGVVFSTRALRLTAPIWWPGHATLSFPSEQIVLASPFQRNVIAATQPQADLRLRPGVALEVEEMALTSGAWTLEAPGGSIASAQGLTLRMRQSDENPAQYAFTLDAPAFQPGSIARTTWRVPADWPLAFDSLVLDATVVFDRPIDRRTIEDARPQPRRIDLRRAEALWGELQLRSAAALDVSPEGLLSGELSLQARNWREILTLAESTGALPGVLRPQLENILAALARGGGNPEALDLALTLDDGRIFLGFIPLGEAPRLVLR